MAGNGRVPIVGDLVRLSGVKAHHNALALVLTHASPKSKSDGVSLRIAVELCEGGAQHRVKPSSVSLVSETRAQLGRRLAARLRKLLLDSQEEALNQQEEALMLRSICDLVAEGKIIRARSVDTMMLEWLNDEDRFPWKFSHVLAVRMAVVALNFNVNSRDSHTGKSLAHFAATNERTGGDVLHLLSALGADLELRTAKGELTGATTLATPAHLAAMFWCFGPLKALKDLGKLCLDAPNIMDKTPMACAIKDPRDPQATEKPGMQLKVLSFFEAAGANIHCTCYDHVSKRHYTLRDLFELYQVQSPIPAENRELAQRLLWQPVLEWLDERGVKNGLATESGSAAGGDACAVSCAACGVVSSNLKACSRCFAVSYCNARCQRGHWREHKATCSTAPRGVAGVQGLAQSTARAQLKQKVRAQEAFHKDLGEVKEATGFSSTAEISYNDPAVRQYLDRLARKDPSLSGKRGGFKLEWDLEGTQEPTAESWRTLRGMLRQEPEKDGHATSSGSALAAWVRTAAEALAVLVGCVASGFGTSPHYATPPEKRRKFYYHIDEPGGGASDGFYFDARCDHCQVARFRADSVEQSPLPVGARVDRSIDGGETWRTVGVVTEVHALLEPAGGSEAVEATRGGECGADPDRTTTKESTEKDGPRAVKRWQRKLRRLLDSSARDCPRLATAEDLRASLAKYRAKIEPLHDELMSCFQRNKGLLRSRSFMVDTDVLFDLDVLLSSGSASFSSSIWAALAATHPQVSITTLATVEYNLNQQLRCGILANMFESGMMLMLDDRENATTLLAVLIGTAQSLFERAAAAPTRTEEGAEKVAARQGLKSPEPQATEEDRRAVATVVPSGDISLLWYATCTFTCALWESWGGVGSLDSREASDIRLDRARCMLCLALFLSDEANRMGECWAALRVMVMPNPVVARAAGGNADDGDDAEAAALTVAALRVAAEQELQVVRSREKSPNAAPAARASAAALSQLRDYLLDPEGTRAISVSKCLFSAPLATRSTWAQGGAGAGSGSL